MDLQRLKEYISVAYQMEQNVYQQETLLDGYAGDDYLIGGYGNDVLDGGRGNDVYVFFKGQELDYIEDVSGNDTILMIGFSKYDSITFAEADAIYSQILVNGKPVIKVNRLRGFNAVNSMEVHVLDVVLNPLTSAKIQNFNTWKKYYKIACPVSVAVVDQSGKVVAELQDGIERTEYKDFGYFYEYYNTETNAYEKEIYLADGYSVRPVGTANGTMSVDYSEADQNGKESKFRASNIQVSKGETFTFNEQLREISSEQSRLTTVMSETACETHSWGNWQVTKNATETSEGEERRICSKCGQGEKRPIAKSQQLTTVKLIAAYNGAYGVGTKWIKVDAATQYTIWRKYQGVWKAIKTVKPTDASLQISGNTIMYTDQTVKKGYGKGYIYSVSAQIGNKLLDYDRAGVAIYRLNPPTLKKATNPKAGSIKVTWKGVFGKTETNGAYDLQYATESDAKVGKWTSVPQKLGNTTTSTTITGLKKGTKYILRIRCSKTNKDRGTFYSEYSKWLSVTIKK